LTFSVVIVHNPFVSILLSCILYVGGPGGFYRPPSIQQGKRGLETGKSSELWRSTKYWHLHPISLFRLSIAMMSCKIQSSLQRLLMDESCPVQRP